MIGNFLRAVWIYATCGGVYRHLADWTKADAEALEAFLKGNTGRRLSARLRATSLTGNAAAVQKGDTWQCGHASGYMGCIADLQSLSANGSPQETESEDVEAGAVGTLEHLAP